MHESVQETAARLDLLRQKDRFRDWTSLDDRRICTVCGRQFSGHEVRVHRTNGFDEIHCPTKKCEAGVHEWIYPNDSLPSAVIYADWWRSLSQPITAEAGEK